MASRFYRFTGRPWVYRTAVFSLLFGVALIALALPPASPAADDGPHWDFLYKVGGGLFLAFSLAFGGRKLIVTPAINEHIVKDHGELGKQLSNIEKTLAGVLQELRDKRSGNRRDEAESE